MKKLLLGMFLIMPASLFAAEASVEACATASFSVSGGNSAPSVSEVCIDIFRGSALNGDYQTRVSNDYSETHWLRYGGCNSSGASRDYDVILSWNYTIVTSEVDWDPSDKASAWFEVFGKGRYTEGSDQFTEERTVTISDGVCADFILVLAAGASAANGENGLLLNDAGVNGLFYDADNPGHGLDFNMTESGLVIYYYGHTSDGERLWLISEPYSGDLNYFDEFEVVMYEVPEGTFGQPALPETAWGTGIFQLSSCHRGFTTLAGEDGEIQISFERLAGIAGLECEP